MFSKIAPILSASKKRDDAFENKVRRPPNEYLFSAGSDGIFALAGSQVFPAALPAFRHLSPLASAARKCYNRLMNIPSDPVMMLSALNMLLRDCYPSLAELCAAEGLDKSAVETALAAIDYRYDPEANQFV